MSDRREICHRKCHTNRDSGGAVIVSDVYDNNLASDLAPVSGGSASAAESQTSETVASDGRTADSGLSRNSATENATPAPRPEALPAGRERLRDYFERRVVRAGPGECWAWLGHIDKNGYGWASKRPYHATAHRLAYELFIGPIPDGLHIDHLCRNRGCVNPAHLEPVTPVENVLRGIGPTAVAARRATCEKGHLLSGANLYRRPNGVRCCRVCKRAQNLKDKRAARERRHGHAA